MAYQVGFADLLKALVVPWDPLMVTLLAGTLLFGTILILVGLLARGRKRSSSLRRYWWIPALLGAFYLLVLLVSPAIMVPMVGSGWLLEDSRLHIKAPPVKTELQLAKTTADLTDYAGPWRPVRRTNGYGTSGLTTGCVLLGNGEKATFFRHQQPSEMLVLESEGRYFVLAHPGVGELYRELQQHGVRQGGLIAREDVPGHSVEGPQAGRATPAADFLLSSPWLGALILWSMAWKVAAVWQSIRNAQIGWCIALVLINTAGVLEIVYLVFFRRNLREEDQNNAG